MNKKGLNSTCDLYHLPFVQCTQWSQNLMLLSDVLLHSLTEKVQKICRSTTSTIKDNFARGVSLELTLPYWICQPGREVKTRYLSDAGYTSHTTDWFPSDQLYSGNNAIPYVSTRETGRTSGREGGIRKERK